MPPTIVLEEDDEDEDDHRDLAVRRDSQEDLVRASGLPVYNGPMYPPDQDD